MKYTLITGASAGIGKALAHKFASQGHNLILSARRLTLLEEIKQNIQEAFGVEVITFQTDLEIAEDVEKLYKACSQYEVDVFINNAGLGDYSYSWDLDQAKASAMVDVNIKALTVLSLKYIQDYVDKDATLINVSSGGGYFVFNKAVTYCATKFYVSSFTEGIAQNLIAQGRKLRVKLLAPGGTESEFISVAENKAGFKGADIFDQDSFISSELLSDYAYQLYESEKIVGLVNQNNEIELRDPLYPFGG